MTLAGPAGAAPGGGKKDRLSQQDRELLAEARGRGDRTVTLLIAAQPGANSTVAGGLAGLGATVRFRDDDISYIRADVPTRQVEAAAALNGVEAVELDKTIPLDDPQPDAA